MGEVGPGTNGSTDDDMSDLFRSFLVDGEDLLPVGSHSTGSSGHHSGSGGGPPAGFGLRVGGGGGGGGHRGGVGHDAEAAATAAMRRRTSASPDMDEMGGGGGGGSQVCFKMSERAGVNERCKVSSYDAVIEGASIAS